VSPTCRSSTVNIGKELYKFEIGQKQKTSRAVQEKVSKRNGDGKKPCFLLRFLGIMSQILEYDIHTVYINESKESSKVQFFQDNQGRQFSYFVDR